MKVILVFAALIAMLTASSISAATWPETLAREGYYIGWESVGTHKTSLDDGSDVKKITRQLESEGYQVIQRDKNILVIPRDDAITNVSCSLSAKNDTLSQVISELRNESGVPIFSPFLRQQVLKKKIDVEFSKIPLNEALSKVARSAGFSTWILAPCTSKDGGPSFYLIEFR